MLFILLVSVLLLLFFSAFSALSEFAQITLRSGAVEDEAKLQKLWHVSDAANRVMMFTVLAYAVTKDYVQTVYLAGFALAVYWLLFDMLLNGFRDKPMLYVGYASAMDKGLRQMAESIHVAPEVLALLLKLGLIGITFLLVVL